MESMEVAKFQNSLDEAISFERHNSGFESHPAKSLPDNEKKLYFNFLCSTTDFFGKTGKTELFLSKLKASFAGSNKQLFKDNTKERMSLDMCSKIAETFKNSPCLDLLLCDFFMILNLCENKDRENLLFLKALFDMLELPEFKIKESAFKAEYLLKNIDQPSLTKKYPLIFKKLVSGKFALRDEGLRYEKDTIFFKCEFDFVTKQKMDFESCNIVIDSCKFYGGEINFQNCGNVTIINSEFINFPYIKEIKQITINNSDRVVVKNNVLKDIKPQKLFCLSEVVYSDVEN